MLKSLTILVLLTICKSQDYEVLYTTADEIDQQVDQKVVYYGSTVRLENFQSQYFLHSHTVTYGSGSGQQSVTGMQTDNDYNSLWTIKECNGSPIKLYSDEVKCGDCISLEHMITQKNLHSHDHRSPVTNNLEVSGYGNNGQGDDADNWNLLCEKDTNTGLTVLKASMWFYLQHKLKKTFLRANKRDFFNQRNCGHQCPIEGQLEISATYSQNEDNRWKIYGGLFYVQPKQDPDSDGRRCNSYGSCDDIDETDDDYQTINYRKVSDL